MKRSLLSRCTPALTVSMLAHAGAAIQAADNVGSSSGVLAALGLALLLFLPRASAAASTPVANPSAIPLDQIGVTAEKQYSGDGLSVWATNGEARLRCV